MGRAYVMLCSCTFALVPSTKCKLDASHRTHLPLPSMIAGQAVSGEF